MSELITRATELTVKVDSIIAGDGILDPAWHPLCVVNLWISARIDVAVVAVVAATRLDVTIAVHARAVVVDLHASGKTEDFLWKNGGPFFMKKVWKFFILKSGAFFVGKFKRIFGVL